MIVSARGFVASLVGAAERVDRWAAAEDHRHAESRRSLQARRLSLLARATLRALLSETTGRSDWTLTADARGKLHCLDHAGRRGPAVSLSHSGDMVAAAMTGSGALGIDVERRRERDFAALAAYAFGPQEQAEAKEGDQAFYRVWTLREALAKASGDGLAMVTDGRDRVAGGARHGCWTIGKDSDSWRMAHLSPHAGYSVGIAHSGPAAQSWGPGWTGLDWRCDVD